MRANAKALKRIQPHAVCFGEFTAIASRKASTTSQRARWILIALR
jgi:hypothetical protein